MALIELSLDTPDVAADAPRPAYLYRRAGLALAAVLVLALGGAAPGTFATWRHDARIPMAGGTDFQLAGGRIYVVDEVDEALVLSAWEPEGPRRIWSRPPEGSHDGPYFVSAATGDLAMLRTGRRTDVLDARTGELRWSATSALTRLTDRTGFMQVEQFRPGTEYDPASGDPGRLYGITNEVLHTEPALSTELRGVDLVTGATRWATSLTGSVYATWTGAARNLLVVLSAGRLAVLSPATGKVLRERAMTPQESAAPSGTIPSREDVAADAAWGEVVGDLVLVHQGSFGEGGRVTAYALDTLDQRWQRDQPDPAGSSATCVALLCQRSPAGLTVLDPATGLPRWQAGGGDLRPFGAGEVLQDPSEGSPLRTRDRATGRIRAEFPDWEGPVQVAGLDAYVLTHLDPDGHTVFGLLLPDRAAVQVLGRMTDLPEYCMADTRRIACRVAEGAVEVWSYRS